MQYLRADYIAAGFSLEREVLQADLLDIAWQRGAVIGGGLVEADANGVPLAIRGLWRVVYRIGDWLMLVAVMRGARQ
jgi:hypothetical protein